MHINLNCPMTHTGYGVTGRGMFRALVELDHDVAWYPIGSTAVPGDPELEELAREHLYTNIGNCYKSVAFNYRMFQEAYLFEFPISKGLRVGNPVFELDRVPYYIVERLNLLDALCVPSAWERDVLIECKVKRPIFVVPHGIDQKIFKFDKEWQERHVRTAICKDNPFTFLHVGKWEKRKGQEEILSAFKDEFGPDEPVKLTFLSHNPFLEERSSVRLNTRYGIEERVDFQAFSETQDVVAYAMKRADCGVFPARAEGWNLPLSEMMAVGKPVICQNVTGHTAYVTEKNAILLEPGPLVDAYDGVWFFGQGRWHDIDVMDLRKKMRAAYEQGRTINYAGVETGKELSWKNAAQKLVDTMREITAPWVSRKKEMESS